MVHNTVRAINRASNGELWFGTEGGVSQYDGEGFLNLTTKDGLANNQVSSILQAPGGVMWFGILWDGVSSYDGKKFVNFTTKDGLAHNYVFASHQDPDGVMWFGTWGGVSRYDGNKFTNFTPKDGLPHLAVLSIHRSSEDVMWFGTEGGVSRYDGEGFFNLTAKDGLPSNQVVSINSAPDGVIWFGTLVGVSRYARNNARLWLSAKSNARLRLSDGTEFHNFNAEGGLAGNSVAAIHRDADGMWFGTDGGVSRFDDTTWTSLDTRDGLAGNMVWSIHQDADGSLWFGTDGGVTRYRRSATPPSVRIIAVKTDREYTTDTHGEENLQQAISPVTTGRRVTIKYSAIDFKTVPEKRQYRYRIKGINDDWRPPTKETFFDYTFKKPGAYTFQVQAIDRDLNYSEPASLTLTVVPPWYKNGWIVFPSAGAVLVLLIVCLVYGTQYYVQRRKLLAYQREAVEELLDAQKVQMSLMPETAPEIDGLEIAGKCFPANTVSGDFFDYLESKQPNEIAVVVGDVTGHAMKGAMNAVMTDGILHATAIEQECFTPASLMITLNNALKGRLEQYMNVTMVIGMIDAETRTLTLANAAHHAYPLLWRNGDIQILKTGGLPLGMRANVEYSEEEFQLQSDDIVVFMTDGIIEAMDSEEHYYSDSGRLEKTISQFASDMSTEAMVDAIINDVIDFGSDKTNRDDDITVVVAKIQ